MADRSARENAVLRAQLGAAADRVQALEADADPLLPQGSFRGRKAGAGLGPEETLTASDAQAILGVGAPEPVTYVKRTGPLGSLSTSGRSFFVTAASPTAPDLSVVVDENNVGGDISYSSGVFTVNTSGDYRLGGYFTIESTAQRAQAVAEVYVNGVAQGDQRGASYIRTPSVYTYWAIEVAPEIYSLSAGDTIEIRLYQVRGANYQAGGTLAIYCHEDKSRIWLEKLGAGPRGATGPSAEVSTFVDYNNAGGPITLVANTWTDVPNDGAGPFSQDTYAPEGLTTLLDASTGHLDFTELNLGSQVLVRSDFTVTPSTNNALLEIRYQLGGGAGLYALSVSSERLDSGSGIGYQRVVPFPIYMGDTNTRDNPGRLQVRLSTAGTLNNAGFYIMILNRP